jgi:hypothetical protein
LFALIAGLTARQYNARIVLKLIPDFGNTGYLPPGIHKASLSEIEKCFAFTPNRKQLFLGLKYLAKVLKRAGCRTLYIDGSFTTTKLEPEDYDAVWEPEGVNQFIDPLLRDGWNFEALKQKFGGDVFCRMPEVFGKDHLDFFQTDRQGVPKGIIMVDLTNEYDHK